MKRGRNIASSRESDATTPVSSRESGAATFSNSGKKEGKWKIVKLGIVGTGAMGEILKSCAEQDDVFDEIYMIEPAGENPWPKIKLDLIIDFSHPNAIYTIYDYCRDKGGNIPVVIGTTGYQAPEEKILTMLRKICPVEKKTNFSEGIKVMCELSETAEIILDGRADVRVTEIHHTKKKDAPSGTAKTLCHHLKIDEEDFAEKITSIRMGTVFGQHTVYFAMEDEVLEIRHTAYSKKIFALGAVNAGKSMLSECRKLP